MFVKKNICCLLILLMSLSFMSGCTKAGTKSTSTATTSLTSANESTVKAIQKPLEPLNISIKVSHGNSAYLSASPNINENKYVKKINEMANVKLNIELLDHNKLNEVINLMYASGGVPDVYVGGMTPVTEKAIKEGVYLNLKPLINEKNTPNILKKVPEVTWKFADVLQNGSIFYIPRFTSVKAPLVTFIRADLLEKYKLNVPDTLDEYVNVMRVFKQNGVKYPTSGREGFTYMTHLFGAFGVTPGDYIMDKDGKIVPAGITPQMKEALKFLRQIYEEGLLDPEFLSNTGTVWLNQKCNAGLVGIFNHQLNRIAQWTTDIKANVPDVKLIMLPGPKGPEGKRGSVPMGNATAGTIFINKNVKDPDRVVKFIDWMSTDEAQTLFQLGIEGDTYKKINGKIEFTYPTTVEASNELIGRMNILNFMGDYDKREFLLPYMPYGKETLEYIDKHGSDGIPNVKLLGENLKIYDQRPELLCGSAKDSLWLEIASKIVYGKEPVDAFDKWVSDWKARGGDTVLQQLEEKRKAGAYVELK